MPGLIGKKIGMTSVFTGDGDLVAVTVIKVDPCKIVNIKSKERTVAASRRETTLPGPGDTWAIRKIISLLLLC